MRNRPFQTAIMNDTEPSASQIAAFEKDVKSRTVKVVFYNKQTAGDLTAKLQRLARDSKVAVVGVTETEPSNMNYQGWMMQQLDETERGLAAGTS